METSTADLANQWEDDTIWSTSEISVLRQVFRDAQRQNNTLQAKMRAQDVEYQRMKKRYGSQHTEHATSTSQLHEVRKANKRLQIMCANLKNSVDATREQVRRLEEDLALQVLENRKSREVIHKQQIAVDKERLQRKRIEQELSNKDKKMESEIALRVEQIELQHEQEIEKFKLRIEKLQEALVKETRDHNRTKKGLDVLRNHFSSLPYAGEEKRKHMVSEDELTSWT